MANALYPKGKKKILDADIDLSADTIKVALIDTADETYNSSDEFVSDLTSIGVIARSGALASKTTTSGTFDAADITITSVTGDTVEAIVVYRDSGSDATSALIAWIDTPSISFTPNGSDVLVTFNASGIFSI